MNTILQPISRLVVLTTGLALAACGPASYSSSSAMPKPQSAAASDAVTGSSASGSLEDGTVRQADASQFCLDVTDVKQTVGTNMQIWSCHGHSNQTFQLDSGGHLKVYGLRCLAVDSTTGAVTITTCDDTANQQWTISGATIVSSVNQGCLGVEAASVRNGARVVAAACNSQDVTQKWTVGAKVLGDSAQKNPSDDGSSTSAPTTLSPHAATTLTTVEAASMDTLAAKAPARLKAQIANIEKTAASFNLQPQLLVAIAMQESTGGSDPLAYSNGGGMFQFTNTDTWALYGTKNPDDRQNDALEVTAAAYYIATLINQHQGDLAKALREYNGPIADGANPNYISEIYSKMAGNI